MNRAAHTTRLLGQRFGHTMSALRHILPPNLSSWKVALYVMVFLLPGGSFVVLAAAYYENRRARNSVAAKSAKAASAPKKSFLTCAKHCDV
jgi:hypothetical protein